MTEQWLQYLKQAGAQINGQTVIDFGDTIPPKTLPEDSITDVSYLGLLKIGGQEAEAFLQGQFTNDVRQVTPEQSQLSAWCTPKGRILVNFRLFKRDKETFYVLLPQECVTSTLKRLQMYVLRSKVNIEESSHMLVRLGCVGAASYQYISDYLCQSLPQTVNASLTYNNVTVLCIQAKPIRYLVIAQEEMAQSLWQQVTKTINPVGTGVWQLFDILAGVPQIVLATTELFVPQMVNLQALGGVSFKKGCYTGQEIVARMQYLATLKQRMYLVQMGGEALPEAGEAIYGLNGETVGNIVNAQKHPDGRVFALAVMPVDLTQSGELQLQQGTPLKILELPYTLGTPT